MIRHIKNVLRPEEVAHLVELALDVIERGLFAKECRAS